MREQTRQSYHTRISNALGHIARHLDTNLTTSALADIAHLSRSHFHRVFQAMTGANLGDVIRAMRLERAARLLVTTEMAISQVALDCGYESGEALSRAFRRHFGISPSHYRHSPAPLRPAQPSPRIHFDPDNCQVRLSEPVPETRMNIRIETLPARDYYFLENIGPYDNLGRLFEALVPWGLERGIKLDQAELFSFSYDNPREIPQSDLRSEACVGTRTDVAPNGDIQRSHRPAGRYAIYRLQGHYNGISPAYASMLETFIADSDEEIADTPFMEIYLNDCYLLPPEQWLTDLCIPLCDK